MIILPSKVPLFASYEERKGPGKLYIMYFDADGYAACVNTVISPTNSRICATCGNACLLYVVDDKGEYTCSACGKFPRELIQN
jgi:hypothetical protein